jgi:hypothetical protein
MYEMLQLHMYIDNTFDKIVKNLIEDIQVHGVTQS